jgi:hypothetical protein
LWAKFLKVFMILSIFLGFIIPFYHVETASAVGVDTVVKLVVGKAVVRSIAEKAGMALSKTQLENVASVIERKTLEGDASAITFANSANAVKSAGASTRSGFQKYLLDPAMWLTGLDLVIAAVGAFKDGYDGGTPVNVYSSACTVPVAISIDANKQVAFDISWVGATQHYVQYNSSITQYPNGGASTINPVITSTTISNVNSTQKMLNVNYKLYAKSDGASLGTFIFQPWIPADDFNATYGCAYQPVLGDVINTTNVDNSVINNFNNDTYNTNTTYIMNVDMPDVIDYGDTIVWNTIDPNIPVETAPYVPPPPPPDADNDGIPDSTDITPNGDTGLPIDDVPKSIWDKLFPVLLVIKLFGLLGSALMYLVRMFAFIMTIPGIDAIPIDNSAFVWFRSTQIIGIKIYDVVSSLAGVGLSFIVFRAIRRAFL